MEMHIEPGIQTQSKGNPGIQTNYVSTPPAKRDKKTSMVWEHFTIETVSPGCKRACCKKCKKSFAYINGYKVVGTSHFKRHIAKGGCSAVPRNQNQDSVSAPSKMAHESSAGPTTKNNALVKMEMHFEPVDLGIQTNNVETPPAKRNKKTSMVWEHFTIETIRPGCKRACCKQCKKSFAYINGYKVVGTSHFKRHIAKGSCAVVVGNQNQDPLTPLSVPSKVAHESSAGPITENNALVNVEMHIDPVDLGIKTNNVETPLTKRRKQSSMVWEHFTVETVSPGCRRACCKQCKQSFAYSMGSKVAGTSHLKRHIAKEGCLVVVKNQNQDPLTPPSALSKMAHESEPIRPTHDERLAWLETEVRRQGEELRELKRVLRAIGEEVEEVPPREQP